MAIQQIPFTGIYLTEATFDPAPQTLRPSGEISVYAFVPLDEGVQEYQPGKITFFSWSRLAHFISMSALERKNRHLLKAKIPVIALAISVCFLFLGGIDFHGQCGGFFASDNPSCAGTIFGDRIFLIGFVPGSISAVCLMVIMTLFLADKAAHSTAVVVLDEDFRSAIDQRYSILKARYQHAKSAPEKKSTPQQIREGALEFAAKSALGLVMSSDAAEALAKSAGNGLKKDTNEEIAVEMFEQGVKDIVVGIGLYHWSITGRKPVDINPEEFCEAHSIPKWRLDGITASTIQFGPN